MSDAKGPFLQTSAELLPADGQGRTILCDCNGTLFIADLDNSARTVVNAPLLEFLMAAEKQGYEVILHSVKPEDNITYNVEPFMRKRGHEAFAAFMQKRDPMVQSKGDTDSRAAALVIDDELSGGYKPQNDPKWQWEPRDPRLKATLNLWAGLLMTLEAQAAASKALKNQP